jgi:hypothetical protein
LHVGVKELEGELDGDVEAAGTLALVAGPVGAGAVGMDALLA